MEKYISIVEKSSFFAELSRSEILEILQCLNPSLHSYDKKTCLIAAGDPFEKVGIVLLGKVKIIKENSEGEVLLIDEFEPPDMFGEAFICSGQKNIPVSIWAEIDSTIMMIDYHAILHICPSSCSFHTQIIKNMLKTISLKLLGLNQKLEIMQQKTIRDKLLTYLKIHAHHKGSLTFEIPLNRNALAEYIGINRSALSRELAHMQEDRILTYDKNNFTLIQ